MLSSLAFLAGTPALAAFVVAFLGALVLVVSRRWHGHLTVDSVVGVQKFHTAPTPRVGGVPIAAGFLLAWYLASESLHRLLYPLIIAGAPAFFFGLAEDLTKRVSVRARLLATIGCGVLGWVITGYAIDRVNVPGLDWLLGFTMVSVLFTAFTVGGIANAINIIDGFNGLSGGTAIIILGGFAWTFLSVGDPEMAQVCMYLGAAVLGFLCVNWPFGKIFLGDGGAYFVGFGIAWIAVLMLARHPELSAWLPLLMCAYPVLEVVFSMWRRRRRGMSAGDPDRLHLHSLVKKRVVRLWFPKQGGLFRNSLTGLLMWGASLLPVAVALTVGNNTAGLACGLLFCALVYCAVYARISQFVWCFRAATVARSAAAP